MLHPIKLPPVIVRAVNALGFHSDADVAERLAVQRRREAELVEKNERLIAENEQLGMLITRSRYVDSRPNRADIEAAARIKFDVYALAFIDDERELVVYVIAWDGFDMNAFRLWLADALPVPVHFRATLIAHATEHRMEGFR
jgi:hypothetical protein